MEPTWRASVVSYFAGDRPVTHEALSVVPTTRHLLRAKDLADARYFEPLTVDDLARAAGLSRAHFSEDEIDAILVRNPRRLLTIA